MPFFKFKLWESFCISKQCFYNLFQTLLIVHTGTNIYFISRYWFMIYSAYLFIVFFFFSPYFVSLQTLPPFKLYCQPTSLYKYYLISLSQLAVKLFCLDLPNSCSNYLFFMTDSFSILVTKCPLFFNSLKSSEKKNIVFFSVRSLFVRWISIAKTHLFPRGNWSCGFHHQLPIPAHH